MSQASAHKLSFVEEVEIGVTPENPKFQRLSDTRTTIALQRDNLESERLTGSRFPSVPRLGASSVTGDIPADLSFEAYLKFIESALQGKFKDGDPNNIIIVASPDPEFIYGERKSNEDLITLGFLNAQQVSVSEIESMNIGSTWGTLNGTVVLDEIKENDQSIILEYTEGEDIQYFEIGLDETATIDSEEYTLSSLVFNSSTRVAKAGDTRSSFTFLREFSDFEAGEESMLLFYGNEVNTWNLSTAANGIAKSTFTFQGVGGGEPLLEAPEGSTFVEAIDEAPFDTFSGNLKIDGFKSCIVTEYTVNINNNLAPRFAVGCRDGIDASVGQSAIDGSITAFFDNMDLYKKFVNEELFTLDLELEDPEGNRLLVKLPNLRAGSGTQPDVTADGSITIQIAFTAHYDAEVESHIEVSAIEA